MAGLNQNKPGGGGGLQGGSFGGPVFPPPQGTVQRTGGAVGGPPKAVGFGVNGNAFYNEANYRKSQAFKQGRNGSGPAPQPPHPAGNRLSNVSPTHPHPGAPPIVGGSADSHVEGQRRSVINGGGGGY